MKPLKLRTRHMPTKVTKPPKKGKGAKYDRKQQKKITESPDFVRSTKGMSGWSWDTGDNHPFGYYKGKFYFGELETSHGDMGEEQIGSPPGGSWRRAMDFPGRVWIDKKVFSLWQYPTNVSEWKKLIANLSKALGENVRDKYKVEMTIALDKYANRGAEKFIPVKTLMNKLEGTTSKPNIVQRSKDTQNIAHVKSPMQKGVAKVPAGWGSKHRPAGLTASQYHQKIRTSDGVIKLGPIVEEILRERKEKK